MTNQIKTTLFFFLVNIFVLSTLSSYVLSKNILTRGSSLTVKDDSLTSSDKTFSCGFYSISSHTNAFYFSIWFTNSKERTVVWTANRDKPVNRLGSRLSLRRNGVMVLTDYDGATTWETNTTASNVDRAELLDTGNLVLKDRGGNILWQSFDFPTDTLLPNQLFTKNKRLLSRNGPQNFGSGYFSFFFDSDNVLKLIYDGPEISSVYWPDITLKAYQVGRTNYNNSKIAMFDDMGFFSSSDQLQFSVSDIGVGAKRRLTMDYDGNLRAYSLNELSGLWYITWQAVAKPCDIHGLCGENGICVYTPSPKCSCPPNFEPSDLSDWSKGCKPKFHSSCSDSEFVQISHIDYYGFDLNRSQPSSFDECRQFCLGDCRCQAFNYRLTGEGMCFTKNSLFNGFRSNDFPSSMYLRVPRSSAKISKQAIQDLNVSRFDCGSGQGKIVELPKTYDTTNQKFKWVYIYAFAGAIGTIELVLFATGWWFLFKKHGLSASMEDGYRAISNQFRSFSYTELKIATKCFKEKLGSGGFGVVYKGTLADEKVVAVKQLINVIRVDEFWAEVGIIGNINHMNLARMWGFCSESKHKLLVYEYVEKGSLDKHLFSTETLLGWKERFKVAIGTAKGLAYLHHECLEWVIHCDVKPENILLDENFEPKISDFGLAKLRQRGSTNSSSEFTQIRGTKGYMAPEWAMNLPITAKADVYSFGVVILELVKGNRLSSRVVDDQQEVPELGRFVRLAKSNMQNEENSWVEDLTDPRLEGNFSRNQAATMIQVGLSCIEDDRNKRPTMESVVQALAECEEEMEVLPY